jgi:sterol desaturase/sphingolipid hydroxylase (fatty acid hydroxylase superfamily)
VGLPAALSILDQFAAVQRMRRRHRLHHTKGGVNFCITWPLADILFGTLDESAPP